MSAAWYEIHQRANALTEINIFGEIGFEVDAKEVIEAIRAASNQRRIDMIVNSEGGNALVGLAISNAIRASQVPVHATIVGFALSAAANIAISCDRVVMLDGAFLMFHPSNAFAAGGIDDLQRTIELMRKFDAETAERIVKRTGETREVVDQWLRDERWFTSSEALAAKLIDEVKPQTAKLAAHVNLSNYKNVPAELKGHIEMTIPNSTATPQEIRAACSGCDDSFILSEIEKKHSLTEVQACWSAIQSRELAALKASRAAGGEGVPPLSNGGKPKGGEYSGDAEGEFDAKVREVMSRGSSRAQAIQSVARRFPELHQAFILATNQHSKQAQRLVVEKYG